MSGMNGSVFCERLDNDLVLGVLFYADATSAYLAARRRADLDVGAVRYVDLVARPLDACRAVLEFCRLPASLAQLAATALDRDAHRNTAFAPAAKSVSERAKEPPLTAEMRARLDELLTKHGLAPIGDPNVVNGTLRCAE